MSFSWFSMGRLTKTLITIYNSDNNNLITLLLQVRFAYIITSASFACSLNIHSCLFLILRHTIPRPLRASAVGKTPTSSMGNTSSPFTSNFLSSNLYLILYWTSPVTGICFSMYKVCMILVRIRRELQLKPELRLELESCTIYVRRKLNDMLSWWCASWW